MATYLDTANPSPFSTPRQPSTSRRAACTNFLRTVLPQRLASVWSLRLRWHTLGVEGVWPWRDCCLALASLPNLKSLTVVINGRAYPLNLIKRLLFPPLSRVRVDGTFRVVLEGVDVLPSSWAPLEEGVPFEVVTVRE